MSQTPQKLKVTPSKSPKTLTILECHQLLNKLIVHEGTPRQFRLGVRNYTMALLMLDAGLRVGEVVQIQWHHLYFHGQPMENLLLPASITKTNTERTIPLSGRLRNAASDMYKFWWSADGLAPSVYAFYQTDPYKSITTRQVERIIGKASMAAFGREANPHMLRHTFASKIARVASIRVVQDLLGHRQLSSTQVYTHPNQDDKKKAVDAIVCEELTQTSQDS